MTGIALNPRYHFIIFSIFFSQNVQNNVLSIELWQVRLFETNCGSLTQYGMKHMRAFANICNNGVGQAAMEDACMTACGRKLLEQWIPSVGRYSA